MPKVQEKAITINKKRNGVAVADACAQDDMREGIDRQVLEPLSPLDAKIVRKGAG
jgi:hypothetical protein